MGRCVIVAGGVIFSVVDWIAEYGQRMRATERALNGVEERVPEMLAVVVAVGAPGRGFM